MRAIQFLLLPLMFSMILIGPARADHEEEEPKCNSRQAFVEELGSTYKETQLFLGLMNPFTGVELFVNETNGSWTLISTEVNGRSCIIAAGNSFQIFKTSNQ